LRYTLRIACLAEAMDRFLRYLLIATALIFGQHAAQLHAFSHVPQESRNPETGQKGAPVTGHLAAQCLVFHAVDSAIPNVACSAPQHTAPPAIATYFVLPLPLLARFEFESRAPPFLS
jgi:hypothetical protein